MTSPNDPLLSAPDIIPTTSSGSASPTELAPLILSNIQVYGTGLGAIAPDMFEPTKWSPAQPVLDLQYLKFVTLIVCRIRAGESNLDEVRRFVELLATDGEDAFWAPVGKLIPEETKDRLEHSSKPGEASLSSEMVQIRRLAERSCWAKLEEGCEEGLKEALFGREAIIPKGGRQDKFLQSWIETGYPAARERGRGS
ncbi:MAG: hypothetical protein Q9195_005095 [Heterodermia aff. obscurata]